MNNFLLTYMLKSSKTYSWFESEEELKGFVEQHTKVYGEKFEVTEAMEIINDRQIEI